MDEQMTSKEKTNKLSFMYDRFCSINGHFLKFWIENSEFQEEILSAMSKRVAVDERFVLNVMISIYNKQMLAIQNGEAVDFNYKLAKRAIKKLEAQV